MMLVHVFVQVCLPIFLMIGAGWLLDRKFRLDLATMVKLNIYLFVPAFIFVQVASSTLAGGQAFRVVGFTLAVIAAMFALGSVVGRLSGYTRPQTRALQLTTMFYNSGNYGIPLMALAFPGAGPLLQVFIVLTQNVTTFSVGLLLAAATERSGWRILLPVLRQVSIWAVAAALLVRAFDIPVQSWPWLWTPLNYLSAALIGVALVTLGAQLSQTQPAQPWRRLSWALALRLLASPAIAVLLVPLFGFHGEYAAIMILSASFPTAVNVALLAHEFKADAQFAAATVFYSTLLSMITVTALLAILRLS